MGGPVKLTAAIDLYCDEMWHQGRFTSKRTETSYRHCLQVHAADVGNRDPRATGREDVKRTLSRWKHPNTQARNRSMLVSFYDWLMEEGFRKDNPARQTRRPKTRKAQVYRLTREEVTALLQAARSRRERWTIYLGICAGLRREELRLLQGRHFARDGWIWVSADIAKGSRERWVPVVGDLRPVVAEIRELRGDDEYVLAPEQFADPGWLGNSRPVERTDRPGDGKTIWRTVRRVAKRAGITADVGAHTLRHAFADHIARLADLQSAQSMLGHADLGTTQTYLGKPTLDDLAEAVAHVRFLPAAGYPPAGGPESQEWRRWESNPRSGSSISQSVIRDFGVVLRGLRERLGEAVA